MRKRLVAVLAAALLLTLWAASAGEQTILTAYAPTGSDGSTILLTIDWAQVMAAAPEVTSVLIRRRPAGPPIVADTVAVLPADSSRCVDTGLDASTAYHYYAYFKNAEGETQRFGSYPAVVHLGPIYPLPPQ